MPPITLDTTVGAIVRAAPVRARVFEKLGIDYCCGGKKPLVEVCHARGLDPITVATMLTALDEAAPHDEIDPDALSLAQLCDHIEQAHHDYLRDELPRLKFLSRKVAAVHGENEPRLQEIRDVFTVFAQEITSHLAKEEGGLFPRIRELEAQAWSRAAGAAELAAAIAELEREHDHTGDALVHLHVLTNRFTPPEWACNSFRALYDGLARLEQNMHQHVHKENNVLFPRALALE